MNYHEDTQKLIDRMCRLVKREDFVLDKDKATELIMKTYDVSNLPRPKQVVWCVDIFDESFRNSASSARSVSSTFSASGALSVSSTFSASSAFSAFRALSASSARSVSSTFSAFSAFSASSAFSAFSALSASSAFSALDYDFDWFVFEYEYCKENTDMNDNDYKYLEYCDLLIQAMEAGAGYRVEWKDTLYIVPTPLVKIDVQNRFHSDIEPAIRWKGGKELYFIHGVNVEEWVVKAPADQITKEQVLNEQNQEVKRCIIEKVGYERYLGMIEAKIIHTQGEYKLWDTSEILDGEPLRLIECKDTSTDGIYFLRVPKDKWIEESTEHLIFGDMKEYWESRGAKVTSVGFGEDALEIEKDLSNCHDAIAWTFSLAGQDYNPIAES